MTTPWHRVRPTGAVDVATDDDDFVTVDRWPSEVFRPHYHDAEFNWIVPLRAGRVVVSIDGEEFAIDGDHWLCVFPRAAHAVVHVSDDCEVLSLFIPDATMAAAWDQLMPAPVLGRPEAQRADHGPDHGAVEVRRRRGRQTANVSASTSGHTCRNASFSSSARTDW